MPAGPNRTATIRDVERAVRTTLGLFAAGALLNLLWLGPDAVDPRATTSLRIVPEAWLLVGLCALLPASRIARTVRWVAALLFTLLLAAAFGHVAVEIALGRPLTLPGDVVLLVNGYELLAGQFGEVAAIAAAVAAAGLAVLLTTGLTRLLRTRRPARPAASLAAVAATVLAVHAVVSLPFVTPRVAFEVQQQVTSAIEQQQRLAALDAALAERTAATALPALAGRNVWLVWIESYGAGALDAPPVAEVLRARRGRLAEAGIGTASGWLQSPIRGGQSWLAHATLLSGLPIGDEQRYRRMLAGGATTLADDFAATGHSTAAVMPAILDPWPEGAELGFESIHDAAALEYFGPDLGWVTMPDEFTLRRAIESVRPTLPDPAFVQVALISSHAPWQPVLPVLGTHTALDDGRAFTPWAGLAPGPGAMRESVERLRERYHDAIAYSLTVTLDWTVRTLGPDDLLLVVGDHPPAPLIAPDPDDARVPVHALARDAALLASLQPLGLRPGLEPGESILPMNHIRAELHRAFGPSPRSGAEQEAHALDPDRRH